MKKVLIFAVMVLAAVSVQAQNRWNVYAGGSISHVCGGYFDWNADGNTNYNWGGGAILGGGYEVNLSEHWSINPALEFSYTDNGAYYNKTGKPAIYGASSRIWSDSWAVNIPVTAGFRFPVSENVKFKIEAGVYLSEAFSVRHFVNTGTAEKPVLVKKKFSSDFGNDFQIGFAGGVAVETGDHFAYFIRTAYPFLVDRWSTSTLTLALGVKYYF